MSQAQHLRQELARATASLDEAAEELHAARARADEAVDHYSGLGGSAGRAQTVVDAVDAVQAQVGELMDQAQEMSALVDAVDPAGTPQENLDTLGTLVEACRAAGEAVTAVLSVCWQTESDTHAHLAGSAFAEDIAWQLSDAAEHLEGARTGLDGVAQEALAQQEAYQAGLSGGAGPAATPSPAPASGGSAAEELRAGQALAALPPRTEFGPTLGQLLGDQGRPTGAQLRSSRDPSLLDDLALPTRGQLSEAMISHVEAKVAAMIRHGQAPKASVLVINNTDGPCGWLKRGSPRRRGSSCDELLPAILPVGAQLTVWWRDTNGVQRQAVYCGTGEGIKG